MKEKKGLHKVLLGVSIGTVILGIILAVMGNMLGIWIALVSAYGVYSSHKKLGEKPAAKDKQ